MTETEFSIQPISNDQLEETANCHISAFPDSFASKLGINYVKKMLEWYIVSEDRFLLGVLFENNIVGYVGGSKGYGSTSGMLQYAYWQGLTSIAARPNLLFNFTLFSHVGLISRNVFERIYKYPRKKELSATKIPHDNTELSIGLVVIGVHQDFRRKGIGSILLKAFTEKSFEIGGFYGHLSVKTTNTNAIKAYQKNGWKITHSMKNSETLKIRIR